MSGEDIVTVRVGFGVKCCVQGLFRFKFTFR